MACKLVNIIGLFQSSKLFIPFRFITFPFFDYFLFVVRFFSVLLGICPFILFSCYFPPLSPSIYHYILGLLNTRYYLECYLICLRIYEVFPHPNFFLFLEFCILRWHVSIRTKINSLFSCPSLLHFSTFVSSAFMEISSIDISSLTDSLGSVVRWPSNSCRYCV